MKGYKAPTQQTQKASEYPVRKAKLMMPLKKPTETAGADLNRDSLVKKNLAGECNRQVSTVSRSSVSDIEIGPGYGVAQLLEEVLLHILGFLTFADVKSARLVNKHWRQVATTLLRRSSKQIELDPSVSECITKMGDGQFPVNRLRVRFTDSYVPDKKKIYSAYFPGICAWVKELTLQMDMNMCRVWFPGDVVTFPTDCVYKDLTSFNLRLIQCTDLCQESWNGFTNFVRCILKESPNLREVNVGYVAFLLGSVEKLTICPVVEDLFTISNSVVASKLSSMERVDLAKWSTLDLRLRKLELNVPCFSNTNNLLAKILEAHTGTLKQLALNLNRYDFEGPEVTFTFPKLQKLEQLRVIYYSIYAPLTFAEIDYARLFPCLKKLDLEYYRGNWRDFLGNDLLEPTNTVEELIFPRSLGDDANLTPNPVVIAAKLFTGLKKLEISADRVFTEAVYKNMPNLEVLACYESCKTFKTFDDIITGLEMAKCREFKGIMTETWIKKLQNAEGRSMARLQNLKTLKLSYWGFIFSSRLSISRLSFHVFKQMSSLKCLDLFHGCAKTAERYSANEDQKRLLEELRANFVVL